MLDIDERGGDVWSMDIKERLKQARRNKGMTQRAMAKALGITPGAYSNYETGLRDIAVNTVVEVCKLLDVSSDWLLGLSEETETVVKPAITSCTGQVLSIQAADNSCAPLINQGDMVAYIPKDTKDGELVCAVSSGRPVFGRLVGEIIVPTNPSYPVIHEYVLLGPAYQVVKKIQ